MNKATKLLVLAGLVLRLFLIFPGPLESKVEFFYNRVDLRNYYWPAQAALRGENPYALWASGQSGEFRADMAPLELALYVATVAVWNDPRALQVLFALFDAFNIVLLGALFRASPIKLPFQIFYVLGPLTLYNLVLVPQDKTILLTLTFLIFYLLTRDAPRNTFHVSRFTFQISRSTLLIIIAALLASFKWLSAFYIAPLLLFVSRDWRAFVKRGALFGAVVALAHLPWLPDWLYVYQFRAGRTATPMHTAPAVLLDAFGWFDKNLLLVLLVVSLGAIYALFWFKRIDIFETIALSVMVGILWTPDMDPVHLSIVVLHFLLIVNWSSRGRLIAVWGLSAWVAAVYALSTRTGFTRYGLPDAREIVGAYGSAQMIVLSYGLFAVVLGFYLFDKLRGRAVGRAILSGER
ncbi:MAG: hypothetical protein FJ009_04705 [Chloroflexi bacterium]|nr:hypothetical protein [Chloroflexota bacterium]